MRSYQFRVLTREYRIHQSYICRIKRGEQTMYYCCLRFYLTGRPCSAFESMKEILPFKHFTHDKPQDTEKVKITISGKGETEESLSRLQKDIAGFACR